MSDSELISSYDSDSDTMDDRRRRQLFGQITELQSAVTDMKSAFTTAIQQLGTFQHEENDLWEKMESNKTESEKRAAELLKLMLAMRTEFVALKNQVQTSNEIQQNLQQQIQNLSWERNLLIEELYKSGSISEQIRYHLRKCHHRFVSRAASGTRSSDSGVAVFGDKVPPHSPFRDNESFYEPPGALESPLLRDFVLGLDDVEASESMRSYDSESSLVNAANKSLTLSSSLGKQCGLELDQSESNTDDDEEDAAKHTYSPNVENHEETQNSVPLCREETRGEDQRKRVVASILETERSYCKMLLTLREIFAEPLKRNGIVSAKDGDTLFPDEVYQIYAFHSTFLLDLEEATDGNVGPIFDKFTSPVQSDVLRLYTSYVDDFPEVLKVFHKLCRQKNKKFTDFLKSCLLHPECGGRDLGAFLVAPVQRIPRYILFLKKLLRVCGESHSDRPHLRSTLRRLKDFLERLNDTMEHSFQLIVSQIHPEKEGLHSDNESARNKTAPRCVADVWTEAPSLRRAPQKPKSKEGEESGGDSDGRSGCGRCYRYPWREGGANGGKCGYPTRRADLASPNSGRRKPKLPPRGDGAPARPRRFVARSDDVETDPTPDEDAADDEGLCGEDAADEGLRRDGWSERASKPELEAKCGRVEECASEPNLAEANAAEVRCQQDVGRCCCVLEKGASLACIVPGGIVDERPLAKSQSSFAVHHQHHLHACPTSTEGAAAAAEDDRDAPRKISHSASSPTLKEKKKVSIRASLKNLLLFKKRSGSGHVRRRSHAVVDCSECHGGLRTKADR